MTYTCTCMKIDLVSNLITLTIDNYQFCSWLDFGQTASKINTLKLKSSIDCVFFNVKNHVTIVGKTWQAKINRTIQKMAERDADVLVLTNLDEIACDYV